jgi:2,5-diketo-D-gluconate reductase A
MIEPMETVTLSNGVDMPLVGFGVYQIPPDDTERAVTEALAAGYRSIDTAEAYRNEAAVGRAIGASGIPRGELFVTTKVWISHAGESATAEAYERSLERLGLDHVDLYLVHQPFGDYYGAWRTMERLLADGRVRAIGVSNFYPDRLVDLQLHADVAPMVNQIETHPYFQRTEDQSVMEEIGTQHESWGSFAEGRNDIFEDPTLSAVATTHGKSVAQVILRWLVQRRVVTIPKSVHAERMAENIDVFDFALTDDEMEQIGALDGGQSVFFDHRTVGAARMLNG